MSSTNHNTWLVTGANSGLGLSIALAALRAGNRVLATARGVERAAKEHPEVEKLGGQWLELDVTSSKTEQIVAEAVSATDGRLDVVVNNADFMHLTSLEDARIEDITRMLDTHVIGAIRVTKGVLPTMRAQESGVIVNMSSFSGFIGHAGCGLYSMSKFALEGISEVWAAELGPFGIRVVLLEPGAFRTLLVKKVKADTVTRSEIGVHYLETDVGKTIQITEDLADNPEKLVAGDPSKLAERVMEIVDVTGHAKETRDVLRFPLGKDSLHIIEGKLRKLQSDFEATKALAQSTDYDAHVGGGAGDL
ncbi:hypothetical protein H2200_002899 [Cladophialophora chaetospira]|uniref:Uncharacterized protein n=1 Tax=Cladophialophora chaetospira TaxID=386627 RepID=A0AA38XGB7_9EURO|nr:hypothetical protein H2200_002899 [Cladophialophora chaetospira]